MTGARARKACPGCSRQIGAASSWCVPCGRRMPDGLHKAHGVAVRQLDAATAAGVAWLKQHPHATDRELDVLALAAQGLDNAAIAERLHVTVNTVKDCWRNLSKRWGCTGRGHVIATAFQLGYLTIGRREAAA